MEFPDLSWVKVGADLFELNSHHNLIMADCSSKWPDIYKLDNLTAKDVISSTKVRSPDMEFQINDHRQRTSGCFFCICSIHDWL